MPSSGALVGNVAGASADQNAIRAQPPPRRGCSRNRVRFHLDHLATEETVRGLARETAPLPGPLNQDVLLASCRYHGHVGVLMEHPAVGKSGDHIRAPPYIRRGSVSKAHLLLGKSNIARPMGGDRSQLVCPV